LGNDGSKPAYKAPLYIYNQALARLQGYQPPVSSAASSLPTAVSEDDPNLTSPGSALGTVAYMSPEQARGETLDARTDLFSFGAVLYEMATGRPAFAGNTTAVIFQAILDKTPPAISRLNPDVPADLDRIIVKTLEKDRDIRCQSCQGWGFCAPQVLLFLERVSDFDCYLHSHRKTMFIQVALALLVLIGGYQLFGRFLLRYQLSENHLRVTLFGFWPLLRIPYSEIEDVSYLQSGDGWSVAGGSFARTTIFRLQHRLWSDAVIIYRRRGLLRSILISPANGSDFASTLRIRCKLPLSNPD